MSETSVVPKVYIGGLKRSSDQNVKIAEFDKRPVVAVKSTSKVLERGINCPHILRYLFDTDDGHQIFDDYIFGVKDDLKEVVKALLVNFRFLDANHRPMPQGIQLLRDVIEGLYELYSNGLLHNDLTTENIVICYGEKNLIAKLTRVKEECKSRPGICNYQSLGDIVQACFSWEEWVEQQVTTPKPSKQSTTQNMWSALKVEGENEDDESEQSTEVESSNLEKKSHLPAEVHEFQNCVYKMLSPTDGVVGAEWTRLLKDREDDFYRDPRTLYRHPMFLSPDLCMIFLIQFRMLMHRCLKFTETGVVKNFLTAINKLKTSGWYSNLDPVVQSELRKSPHLVTLDNTQYLLRAIRNVYCHFDDFNDAFTALVGTPPDQMLEYFRVKYPKMLLGIHRVLQFHFKKIKDPLNFMYTFELYL
ncbi:hypothetical protein MKW94_029924 [Papaver nudicaule]|uniref:KEN domain-containing protein n=1 Tax=Papaver nudicaule TaxID=74823 RepID=A0AA41VG83_PAPNU|nr:hypothetical protein [Papaver nudicaule]